MGRIFGDLEKKVDELLKQGIEKTAASIAGKNEGNVELPAGGTGVNLNDKHNKDGNPDTKGLVDKPEKSKTTGGATPGFGPAIQAELDDRQHVGDKSVGDAGSTIGQAIKDQVKKTTSGKSASFDISKLMGMFSAEDASEEKIAELIDSAIKIANIQAESELEKSAEFKPESAFKDSVLLKLAFALHTQVEKTNGVQLAREMDKLAEKLVESGAFDDKGEADKYVKEAASKLKNNNELINVAVGDRIRAHKLAFGTEKSAEAKDNYESDLHRVLGKKKED